MHLQRILRLPWIGQGYMAIDRSARYNRKFAVLFIDFDNFKPFNDRYRHVEGDKVLISPCTGYQRAPEKE